MTAVYISIGNSDDKLTQAEWARFVEDVDEAVDSRAIAVHGRWYSSPRSPFQNACWCIEPKSVQQVVSLRHALATMAEKYRQDSIAWAGATTEFIGAPRG